MNKIEKFLNKLVHEQRIIVLELMEKVRAGDLSNLDIKKLKGKENVFRARKGRVRVIFAKIGDTYGIIDADNRDDNTYN